MNRREYDRKYYQKNKERINARHKIYYEAHKEEIKAYQKVYQKEYRRRQKILKDASCPLRKKYGTKWDREIGISFCLNCRTEPCVYEE